MKVTIIHKEGCPLCERAIREFTGDGNEVELYGNLQDVSDIGRRLNMIADICFKDGDINAYPQVFFEDEYIKWEPKKGE